MLKLTRRIGETGTIETPQGPIKILFEGLKGKQLKIGIAAPKSLKVLCEEPLDNDSNSDPWLAN